MNRQPDLIPMRPQDRINLTPDKRSVRGKNKPAEEEPTTPTKDGDGENLPPLVYKNLHRKDEPDLYGIPNKEEAA